MFGIGWYTVVYCTWSIILERNYAHSKAEEKIFAHFIAIAVSLCTYQVINFHEKFVHAAQLVKREDIIAAGLLFVDDF